MQHFGMIVVRAEQCMTKSKFLVQDRLRYEDLPQLCFVSFGTVRFLCVSLKHSALENVDAPAGLKSVVPRMFALP
jgi:hypothetical protein